ncbi:MAG: hypothetical protein HQL69_12625 [Magnetococcales bacterium]|nr:hypothetical protein [Magnetococcales bacterium]
MSNLEIRPTSDSDLKAVGEFLQANLTSQFTVDQWVNAFTQDWSTTKPNNGFMLCDGDDIVGVVGAIYSQQMVDGKMVDVCNINSWVVKPEYRSDSIYLLIKTVRQPGYHFTILTPRDQEMEIYRFLKFRTIVTRMIVTANIPWPFASLFGVHAVTDIGTLQQVLHLEDARVHREHTSSPWLRHMAIGKEGAYCYVIYQRITLKAMPTAAILYVSDIQLFNRYRKALGSALLLRGMLFMRLESRFKTAIPKLSVLQTYPTPTLVLSDLLKDCDVLNIYSERAALNLDSAK